MENGLRTIPLPTGEGAAKRRVRGTANFPSKHFPRGTGTVSDFTTGQREVFRPMPDTKFLPAGERLNNVFHGVLSCYSFSENFIPLHFAVGDCVSSHFKAASEHCDIGSAHRVPVRAQNSFQAL